MYSRNIIARVKSLSGTKIKWNAFNHMQFKHFMMPNSLYMALILSCTLQSLRNSVLKAYMYNWLLFADNFYGEVEFTVKILRIGTDRSDIGVGRVRILGGAKFPAHTSS